MLPTYPPKYKRIDEGKYKYQLLVDGLYYSQRYDKWVSVARDMKSDGATGARDLKDSWGWWFHDELTNSCVWQDGTPCTAYMASQVLYDILDEEGREIRKFTWKYCTFLFGSWRIKKRVGWF